MERFSRAAFFRSSSRSGHGRTPHWRTPMMSQMMSPESSLLFRPGRIGGVEIRNSIVLPAMTTRLADPEGHVTEATLAYYRWRAEGGAGLLTVEMASPE